MKLPILYTFRRCPYAIRARLALSHCGADYIHREILLKSKPPELLEASSKGTVPVLILPATPSTATDSVDTTITNSTHYRVIDESIDIMHWAMDENPSRHFKKAQEWSRSHTMNVNDSYALILENDVEFKGHLDRYKYSDRFPAHPQAHYLEQAMPFLKKLEQALSNSRYLGGNQFRFLDAAILPFVRQFSMVDPHHFKSLPLPHLQRWLTQTLETALFTGVMKKLPLWQRETSDDIVILGGNYDTVK